MKKLILFLGAFFLTMNIVSCSASQTVVNPEKVQQLITAKEFSFQAERANPVSMDAINVIASMKSNGNQILNLSPGYSVNFYTHKIDSHLPYFGRVFMPSLNPDKNSFDFSVDQFTLDTSKSTSKKSVFIYSVQHSQNINKMVLEIYPNGRAYLSVDASDRQPISYDGYISDLPSATTSK